MEVQVIISSPHVYQNVIEFQNKVLSCLDWDPFVRDTDINVLIWLQLLQFSAEEFLFRSGEVAAEMFFVTAGAVDEIIESQVRTHSTENAFALKTLSLLV